MRTLLTLHEWHIYLMHQLWLSIQLRINFFSQNASCSQIFELVDP